MELVGVVMLGAVAALVIGTGLPAYIALIGVAVVFGAFGVAIGMFPLSFVTALPARVIGLLESDLLQALPLYGLMGALLDRLPLAGILYRAGGRAPLASALGLGTLLAPMNGSVGASVAALARIVHPRLVKSGLPQAQSLAVTCVASTLGVVVPPSLILILLGDAMLRAHTQALNATHRLDRVVNTQDIFRGALPAAALFVLLSLVIAWRLGARMRPVDATALTGREKLLAAATLAAVLGLLGAVAAGYIYPVEGAATGAVALLLCGIASGALDRHALGEVLRGTMTITGALFALFVAATTFTLILRGFGLDLLLDDLLGVLPPGSAVLAALGIIGLCAFVLDAFEIVLVVIPIVIPPVLVQEPDAVWVAVLALLALQASFLIPPIGYAVMMARTATGDCLPISKVLGALAPFLAAQLVVLGATLALPGLTHLLGAGGIGMRGEKPALSDEEVQRQFDAIQPEPPPDPE